MQNKLKKIFKIIKENIIYILIVVIFSFAINIKLPYYIDAPGGLINVKDKINIQDSTISKGTYNMTYVKTYDARVLTYIIAKLNKDWLIQKKEDVILDNETEKEENLRNQILLKEGSQNSIIYAYKVANKTLEITGSKIYVTYIDSKALTDLKIGDVIEEIGGLKINSKDEIQNIIEKYNYDETMSIKTNSGVKKAKIINLENNKKLGILISVVSDIKVDSKITFNYKDNESGSSGGLMSALYIYDSIIDEDLTKGKKIAGTGTIDINGNIGKIGGIKFKLIAANNSKADVFFVPKENYEEAIKIKEERKYKINIVMVNTFNDALMYLKGM